MHHAAATDQGLLRFLAFYSNLDLVSSLKLCEQLPTLHGCALCALSMAACSSCQALS